MKFNELEKSLYWELIQSWVPLRGGFEKIKEFISHYVRLETDPSRFAELENYLNRKKVIGISGVSDDADINRLFCMITLDFIQNRFRDVAAAGSRLDRIAALVPEESKNDLIELYRMIGDAEQRLDYLYDSNAFYQKALDLDPRDLKTLTRMVENYQRLNDAGNVREYMQRINQSVTPMETVFDDVAFGPLNMKLSMSETLAAVQSALETVGITDLKDKASHHLSGGEKRLAAIATLISMKPEIYFMDEPTSNLDALNRRNVSRAWKIPADRIKDRLDTLVLQGCSKLNKLVSCSY
jgi:energy-coupling factor transporter ATP-binding protein EcfA2